MIAMGRVFVCALCVAAWTATAPAGSDNAIELVRNENEFSRAHLELVRLGDRPSIAVVFEGTKDLHYYARSETASSPGGNLKVTASAPGVTFAESVYPAWKTFHDPGLEKDVEVYAGDFTLYVPLANRPQQPVDVTATISGQACTNLFCLPPFTQTITTRLDPGTIDSWRQISLPAAPPAAVAPALPKQTEAPSQAVLPYATWVYYLLAIVAGLSINLMPCVLPVIPLILMRLIEQSKRSAHSRIASGAAFCTGIVVFFLVFALISILINLWTGTALDLNSLFRYPAAVIVLFLAIVLFGLAMLDVITPALPSSIASRQGSGSGIVGSLGMGFFAALLSTPCSGALLGFVLVWAQTQSRLVSGTAFTLMGIGMALPYAVLVAVPSLLARLPKPGAWMDLFKKSTGFLLFFIAVKLTLAALPKDRLLNVLMYGVVFSFCVWMWGKWVDFSTPAARKWTVRLIAVALAVVTALWLLPAHQPPQGVSIDWQTYNAAAIQQARTQGRPVLLDFTADWCTNCKVLDRRVFQDPDVAALVKQKSVLAVRADTTSFDYPATKDLKDVYGEAGNVPVTVVLLPNNQQEKKRGIFDKAWLVEVLRKLPEAKK
jgi:thiol:disulfide interchange protein